MELFIGFKRLSVIVRRGRDWKKLWAGLEFLLSRRRGAFLCCGVGRWAFRSHSLSFQQQVVDSDGSCWRCEGMGWKWDWLLRKGRVTWKRKGETAKRTRAGRGTLCRARGNTDQEIRSNRDYFESERFGLRNILYLFLQLRINSPLGAMPGFAWNGLLTKAQRECRCTHYMLPLRGTVTPTSAVSFHFLYHMVGLFG